MEQQKTAFSGYRAAEEELEAGECFLRIADKLVCLVLRRHQLPPFAGLENAAAFAVA